MAFVLGYYMCELEAVVCFSKWQPAFSPDEEKTLHLVWITSTKPLVDFNFRILGRDFISCRNQLFRLCSRKRAVEKVAH